MKKFLVLAAFSLTAVTVRSQTVFTYGTEQVSKEEFLRAYNKNNTASINKSTALREYLDLYIKFKLKVKAAHDMRIDTLPNINSDLKNFRDQIEESYLNDEKEVNALIQEAFNRSQKDIHILHLFIPVEKSAGPADTLAIYKGAQEAYEALTKNASFDQVAQQLKNKAITASWEDAGFITVFSIPYEFENIVYQLRPGQVSKFYRFQNGYHLFKNIGEREAAGKIKAAQILIAEPPNADEAQKNTTLRIADSVYRMLRAGADFSETAKTFSSDKNTYMSGGVMPEFGTGKYDPAFENMAFALQKDNEITVPFHTAFGYHILKRLGRTPIPNDKNDAEYLSALKLQVQQDARISAAKEKFLAAVLKTLGYKENSTINKNALWRITDSFAMRNKKISIPDINGKTVLFSFNDGKATVEDWLDFAKNYKNNPSLYREETYPELMQKYLSVTAFDNYRKKLDYYNIDFKYQLQEFKDGNMLFEVMERNVWSKASADSAGLVNFFNQNKARYNWKESADVILITCANERIATHTSEQLKAGKSWHQVVEENSSQVQADSGRYELSQIPVKPGSKLNAETLTEPLVNEADSTASFVRIIRLYPADQPRNFEEARGLVINDYQNFLEEKWVEQLKKKYPVKINESIFQSLVNQ